MKHLRGILLALALPFLLAACADTNLLGEVWIGTGQDAIRTWTVRLEFSTIGKNVYGQYYVGTASSPSGMFNGKIIEGDIIAEIKPNNNCTLSFAGTINNVRLVGSYIPGPNCGFLGEGSWNLLKQ